MCGAGRITAPCAPPLTAGREVSGHSGHMGEGRSWRLGGKGWPLLPRCPCLLFPMLVFIFFPPLYSANQSHHLLWQVFPFTFSLLSAPTQGSSLEADSLILRLRWCFSILWPPLAALLQILGWLPGEKETLLAFPFTLFPANLYSLLVFLICWEEIIWVTEKLKIKHVTGPDKSQQWWQCSRF